MRTDRFELLIAHLENVVAKLPPQRFSLSAWGTVLPRNCGTACCVMGHAADIPQFRADGLVLRWHAGSGNLYYHRPGVTGAGATAYGTFAAAEFMDIPMLHAEWMFHPDGYIERSGVPLAKVIARLKQYVADGGTLPPDGETAAFVYQTENPENL